jgi:hypothetical protein
MKCNQYFLIKSDFVCEHKIKTVDKLEFVRNI